MSIIIEVIRPAVSDILKWQSEKLYETKFEGSMLNKLYSKIIEGKSNPDDHLFIVAFNSKTGKVVGILVIEKIAPYSLPMFFADFWRNKTTIKSRFNKSALVTGFLQVYVKDAYREKGIATNMIAIAEQEHVSRNRHWISEDVLPAISALDGAFFMLKSRLKSCMLASAAFYKGRHCSNIDQLIHEMSWKYLNTAVDNPDWFAIPGHSQYLMSNA